MTKVVRGSDFLKGDWVIFVKNGETVMGIVLYITAHSLVTSAGEVTFVEVLEFRRS